MLNLGGIDPEKLYRAILRLYQTDPKFSLMIKKSLQQL